MADLKNLNISSKKPKDIQTLSKDEKQNFLNSFDLVFCDCDGVLWRTMQQPLIGIGKGIEFFKKMNKKITYVTNNSIRNITDHMNKFRDNGIELNEEDIIHPAQTVADYLKQIKFDGLVYVIANTPFKETLKNSGFQVIDGPNHIVDESFQEFYKAIIEKSPVRAVVIDVDFNLSVSKCIRAQLYLKNSDCILIGGASDEIIPLGNTDIIGPGPYINIIEKATRTTAKILGKPGTELGVYLKNRFNITDPSRVLFIGDSIQADIEFGNKNGFQTLLVLTGQASKDNLNQIKNEEENPDYFIESLADFNNFI